MNESLTSLKVEDAYTRDIGKGVMRIDYDSMDSIKARVGDIIEIKGARKTLVVCLPLYPSDDGKGILRADNLVQDNAGISRGDNIGIRKITKVITKNVTVLPLDPIPPGTERYLKDALDGVPVIKGDKIAAPYFGKSLLFQVVKATPAGVVSNQKTKFSIAKS